MAGQRAPSRGTSRRQFLALTGAATVTGLLTACSTETYNTSRQLTFTLWGTGAEKIAVTDVVNKFASAKHLQGNAQVYPQNYDTKMYTLIAANTPPDAAYLTEPMSMQLASEGLLYNVLDDPFFESFIPSAIHHVSNNRAVSANGLEAIANWYDVSVADEAGVTVPSTYDTAWTWDEFVEASDKMTTDSNGRHPSESGFNAAHVQRYGTIAPFGINPLFALLASNGVEIFDDAGHTCAFDSAKSIEVLQALNDLIFEHRVAPNAADGSALGVGAALQLQSKRAAMAVDGQWALLDLNAAKAKGLNFDAGVLPKFGDRAYTLGLSGGIGAFQKSNNRAAGVELLQLLADPTQCPLYKSGLWMPAQEKYYTDPALRATWLTPEAHPKHYETAVADMAVHHAVAYPSFELKNFANISVAINGALTPMFSTKQDVRPAAQKLANRVNSFLQGRWTSGATA